MKNLTLIASLLLSTMAFGNDFVPDKITAIDIDRWVYQYYQDGINSKECEKHLYVGKWVNTYSFSRDLGANSLYKNQNPEPVTLSFLFNPVDRETLYFSDGITVLPINLNYDGENTPVLEPVISFAEMDLKKGEYDKYFNGRRYFSDNKFKNGRADNYLFNSGLLVTCRVLNDYDHQVMICRSKLDVEQGESQGWDVFEKIKN